MVNCEYFVASMVNMSTMVNCECVVLNNVASTYAYKYCCNKSIFVVRMLRRFFLTSDTIDISYYVYTNICRKNCTLSP